MEQFIVRIELVSTKVTLLTEEDYKILHAEMRKENFNKEIVSDKGTTYKLLPGEYIKSGIGLTTNDIIKSAYKACLVTKNISTHIEKVRVMANNAKDILWYDLEQSPIRPTSIRYNDNIYGLASTLFAGLKLPK